MKKKLDVQAQAPRFETYRPPSSWQFVRDVQPLGSPIWLSGAAETISRFGPYFAETVHCLTGTCTEYHMWELSVRVTDGDSGGPIFDYYVEMGIVDDYLGVNTYYSTIDWIDSVMGTTPCLSASC